MHQVGYASAFLPADVTILAPLGRSTIPENERLDLAMLAAALGGKGRQVESPASIDALLETVRAIAKPGDVIVSMSNGAFGGVPHKLAEVLG